MTLENDDEGSLARQVRVLQRRLLRSEEHRKRLEDLHERSTVFLRRLIEETEETQGFMRRLVEETEEAQRALERRNAELEELARELRASEKRAKAASDAKSTFLANVSHELRTPLSGIIGVAEILGDTPLDEDQQGYVRVMLSSGESLLDIINDILDVTLVEAGQLRLGTVALSPRSIAREVQELLAQHAEQRGLTLELLADDNVPDVVLGDRGRLRQILMNLVGNALKFTERGGVKVRVSVAVEDERHVVLSFDVEDTGIGIAVQDLERLFQPFSQADSSSVRRYRGTGLGLYISLQLAGLMGGDIEVESVLHRGSRFRVLLPFERAKETDVSAGGMMATAAIRAGDSCPTKLLRQEVLVVEDDPISAMVARLMLETLGCRVTLVESGAKAVSEVASGDFDAVLMDCHMPVVDGYEATRRIRALPPPARHVTIVALTADARASERARCLDAGMNDYLSKPLRQESLWAVLMRTRAASKSRGRVRDTSSSS